MKTLFRMKVATVENSWWEEIYLTEDKTIQETAQHLIDQFNFEELKRYPDNAQTRMLVCVETIDIQPKKIKHNWHKKNAVSKTHGGKMYDVMECKNCKVTGKRYGVSTAVLSDGRKYCKKIV